MPKAGVSNGIVISQPMQPTQGLNGKYDLLRFSIPTFCPANGEQKPAHRHTRKHSRTQTAARESAESMMNSANTNVN